MTGKSDLTQMRFKNIAVAADNAVGKYFWSL